MYHGSGHRDSNPSTKNETTPMDVDALWKMQGGKYGKGKDKGQGREEKGKRRKTTERWWRRGDHLLDMWLAQTSV
eukprot:4625734-Amphidinium_carterae.1